MGTVPLYLLQLAVLSNVRMAVCMHVIGHCDLCWQCAGMRDFVCVALLHSRYL